jgi:MGT family glycosyltransferase
MLIPTLGKRLMGPGLRPPRMALDRGRQWLLATIHGLARDLRGLPEVNEVRAAYGLPRLRRLSELLLRAPLTLAYTAEPLEYPRTDWPPSVRFVGPGLWDPPAAPPRWMDELDDRPLVLVCGSTVHNGERLVRTALEGLAAEPFQVVATLPRGELPESPPANGRVFRYVPHGILLPRAACVVCPGGFGIVQKSLAAGVPVVVVPGGGDQLETARRVEVAEAGVRLPPKRLTPARLRAAVYRAMQHGAGVERVAAGLRRAGGAAAAADALESLAGRSGGRRNVA